MSPAVIACGVLGQLAADRRATGSVVWRRPVGPRRLSAGEHDEWPLDGGLLSLPACRGEVLE